MVWLRTWRAFLILVFPAEILVSRTFWGCDNLTTAIVCAAAGLMTVTGFASEETNNC